MKNQSEKDELKEKIINNLKAVVGTFGVLGSIGVFYYGIITVNPLLMSAWLLSFPALKITNDGLKADYITQSLFGLSRNKSIKLKNGEGKKEKKRVDIIQQKPFSIEPLDVIFISSDKKFNEEIKKEKKEFKSELKNKDVTKQEKRKIKKEFKDNIERKKKAYSKFKTKQISTFYSVQMLNLFNQLREKDAYGNKIMYSFNSHGVTIEALKKMNGFVENIEEHNAKRKNMIIEKMLMGNLNPIKEFCGAVIQGFKKGPKAGVKKLKNRLGRKSEVHDVIFNLTGEGVTLDQIKKFIGEDALETYSFVQTKLGIDILKFDREKFKEKQIEIIKTVMSTSIQQKNQFDSNFILTREQHVSQNVKQVKEQQSGLNSTALKDEFKKYRKFVVLSKHEKQEEQDIYMEQVEEENVSGRSL